MTEVEKIETLSSDEEKVAGMSSKSRYTLQIVGAAIFGALSAILYPVLKPLIDVTRVPQGLALFDPISIIWVTCFLVFGPLAGIICCLVGFVTIIPFDTSIPVIAPLLKLLATLPLVIVPTLVLRLYKKRDERNSQRLKKPKNYGMAALLSVAGREAVMIPANIIVYTMFFGTEGLTAWLVLVFWVNIITSVWDLLIPYLMVFGTKLDEKFEIW